MCNFVLTTTDIPISPFSSVCCHPVHPVDLSQDRNGSTLISQAIDQHNIEILKELINTRKIHGGTRVRVGENVRKVLCNRGSLKLHLFTCLMLELHPNSNLRPY